MTVGWPPSMTATTELVVPKSMPIIFAISSQTSQKLFRIRAAWRGSTMLFAARLVSTVLLLNLSALLSSPAERPTQEILIGAAADLQPLENSLQTEFLKSTGSKAVFTFAASGSLAQQIRNGAPYDLFLSANSTFVRYLSDSGYLLQDTVQVYGYGRIALWSKGGKIRSLADLTSPSLRHIAIANPTHAP